MSKNKTFVLEEIINNIPYFVFWKNVDSTYLGANKKFSESAGFEHPKDLVGKTDFDCCWSKKESEFIRETDRDLMASDRSILNLEEPHRQKDGSTTTMLKSKVPLHDCDGNVVGLLGIYSDITERKRLETDKIQALTELQNLQEVLIYQERMKSLGEMAGGIAHEINNPLSIIAASAQVIKKVMATGGDPKLIDQSCEFILNTVSRCTKIIDNLKNFSRDQKDAEVETVDVRSIISPVMSLLDFSRKQKIQSDEVRDDKIFIECKKISLEQALLNLMNNAIDEIDEQRNVKAQVRQFSRDGLAGLEVLNPGDPIPEDLQKKIFQPFFTTKEVGKGTGLGLSTSKGLVESCGGQLRYRWEEGMNIFSLEFPRMHQKRLEQKKSRESHVIIVDDDLGLADVLKLSLMRKFKCVVYIFSSSTDAFEYLKGHRAEFVVFNIQKNESEAFKFIQNIRGLNSKVPMAGIVSGPSRKIKCHLEKNPQSFVFNKPVDIERLVALVNSQCELQILASATQNQGAA